MKLRFIAIAIVFISIPFLALKNKEKLNDSKFSKRSIITGADQVEKYLPYLKGKKVGMVVNQTSIIGNKLSVDSLLKLGIHIQTIFGPEHGFRGNASNGAVDFYDKNKSILGNFFHINFLFIHNCYHSC